MKSTFKSLPGSKIDLTVTLDTKEFLEYFNRAYDRALQSVSIKGFRRGMAPPELAGAAVDRDKVFHEAAERAVRDTLDEVKADHEWVAVDVPKVEILDASKTKDVGLEYKAELTVFPEVNLGNYKAIAKKVFAERKPTEVTDEEIEKSLEWLRESRATVTEADREAKTEDMVEADIKSMVDGKPIPGAQLSRDRFVIGKSNFMPGFDEKLAGHKKGETFTFFLTAPADYWQKQLQGKSVEFTVTLHGVFDRTVPALDDVFAASLGAQFKTIEDLKKNIREGVALERDEKEQSRVRAKVIQEIARAAKIDTPEIMVTRTLDMMAANVQAMARGVKKSDEEIRKELEPRAQESVAYHLVLQTIAKQEHLEPTEEEVQDEMKKNLHSEPNQRVDDAEHYDYSYSTLQSRKVFAFLEKSQ